MFRRLAYTLFLGNYSEYEQNKLKRLGETVIKPVKFAPLINVG